MLTKYHQKMVPPLQHLSALRHCKRARRLPCLPKPCEILGAPTRARSRKSSGLPKQRETERLPKTVPRERDRSHTLAVQTPSGRKAHPVWSLKLGDTSP